MKNSKVDELFAEILIAFLPSAIIHTPVVKITVSIILIVAYIIFEKVRKGIKKGVGYKVYCVYVIKLLIMLLYPLTILTLTTHQSLFITTLLLGVKPTPYDGFGAAISLVILHVAVMKLEAKWEVVAE